MRKATQLAIGIVALAVPAHATTQSQTGGFAIAYQDLGGVRTTEKGSSPFGIEGWQRVDGAPEINGNATAFGDLTKQAATAFLAAPSWPMLGDPVPDVTGVFGRADNYEYLSFDKDYRFTSNIYSIFDFSVAHPLALVDPAVIRADLAPLVDPFIATNGLPRPGEYDYFYLGSTIAQFDMMLHLEDTALCTTGICTAVFYRQAVVGLQFAAIFDGNNPLEWSLQTSALGYNQGATQTLDAAGDWHVVINDFTDLTLFETDSHGGGFARNDSLDFEVRAGNTYRLWTMVSCSAYMTASAYAVAGNTAACDASRSLYWNGLTNLRDSAGNRIQDIGVTSASGFDYRNASPLSPSPPHADVVPEPAQWALLIAGFGLVGGAARRRRAVATGE